MDCAHVTSVLIERIASPVLIADPTGRARLVNTTFAQLLGRRPEELIGHHFLQDWISGESRSDVTTAFGDAEVGRARRLEVRIEKEDVRLHLFVDIEALTEGLDRMVIMSVADARKEASAPCSDADFPASCEEKPPSAQAPRSTDDVEYDISLDNFGVLWVAPSSRPSGLTLGSRCFESRFGASEPCANCPALRLCDEPGQACGVVGDVKVEFVTARSCSPDRARIRALPLDEESVRAATRARIERLAEVSRLSSRERDVLRLLIQGRTNEEIATELGIARRTVKFHQANLLDKLGADSRLDLLRILI
ncbi:MAG: LuxR C-terminal-related transcriptional regulator [Byssovorax sp.]